MKKGFSLIELLVSLVIISAVMVFLTSFVLNLRDEKGEINIDVQANINQASISRALNYDAIKHGGICNVEITNNGKNCEITYVDEETRQIILNEGTLTYKDGSNIELVKTLNGNKIFGTIEVPSNYPKIYGNKMLYKFVISAGGVDKDIEVVSYNDNSGCPSLVYTVTWKNWDGTILETDTDVEHGATPTYNGATPTKASTSNQTFTFTGWSPAIDVVTGDIEYVAMFSTTTYTCSTGVTPSISGSTCTCSDTHQVEKIGYYAATPGTYSGYCYCSETSNGQGYQWQGGCGSDTCSGTCPSSAPYVMSGSSATCPRSYSCNSPEDIGPDASHMCGRRYYVNEAYTYDCTATTS